ncbi:MAG TPA: F0F1 ATP synthase subunit A [Ottowia sp.]|uniref:F0F1 ATP synthase subunit A n=1 Tax=Ottowia sp. TaxID=1898956 RepID=UPI002CD6EC50|nr:F0F1 ATP synthase subunit A [Ottowia sp.]HMN22251.1 F0F1 ATP synthase subunit A [Ottowia sp.]
MQLTPDATVLLELGAFRLNATIVNTWIVMALLVGVSWLVTRNLRPDAPPGRWRNALETLVLLIEGQIRAITHSAVRRVMYLAGTLFLFIATANLLGVIPGFAAPTGSLSTTVALTLAVLLAVPGFAMAERGWTGYLRHLAQPTWVLLPFNILGELSKGVSLSIRLYGNVMSGAVIAAILLGIAPFFFPVVMNLFGLLVGLIQAYIFAILAAVYISSALSDEPPRIDPEDPA